MHYRVNPQNGDKLSALGFGCMRFCRDDKALLEQIAYAVEQGVNYFDTAYIYPNSEARLGKALANLGYRPRIRLASKMPTYLVKRKADLERIFQQQLQRLRTDHIDYYLIHMLMSLAEWRRLVACGAEEWIREKQQSGQIGQIGFSYHGGRHAFAEILADYDWQFTMIQYNYLDEFQQAGRQGLLQAARKGLPVMIMEPLRGGLLAHLPPEARQIFAASGQEYSDAAWGLRWLWNQPEVLVVLSGMNSLPMLAENIETASHASCDMLDNATLAYYDQVRQWLLSRTKVACTGCGYCLPCPQGVDIPLCFSLYNDTALGKRWRARFNYIAYNHNHQASRCIGCGRCESHCPQGIPIRKQLAQVAKAMERFPYRPAHALLKHIMKLPEEEQH